ncbi:MAG: hypothetical protein A2729_05750 [Candidatus Buchananbacteria bacterium RIFCSPHIGHO2_01_FULL_39_14]|uniref:Uncharacterized protein n=2 Tax=Candidatus Buchananiibacteriota TaxID=1817903 RepID=A0A1G1YUM8_9BACT|nr:MAG: hypothetical protein A2729_05750 [Candidatus Buchananbacteria bacterium RIFCSPHIGHO2_01_FULL_39_14]OGY48470.1 MAG: hypothetical protein A3D39_02565 [Candidatus Buchananbacteria bacterium RIFCSPHIGHO2_02_FULL_39_17]OGY55290.1 MAG: hypothetical protein A2912_02520 [Candidatus Buchananbacteria bacterium RIFCSPLOWO2_01_FULL_40_23b]
MILKMLGKQGAQAKLLFVIGLVSIIIIAAVVLAIIYQPSFLSKFGGGEKMVVLKLDQAAQDLVSFITEVYGAQVGAVTLKEVIEKNGLYQVTLSLTGSDGQPTEQQVYVSRDGKKFFPQGIDIAEMTSQFRNFQQQQQQGQQPQGQQSPAALQP